MPTPMKVLIAYDGSRSADAALDDLRRAGLPSDVEAVVLSVADVWFMPKQDDPPVTVAAERMSSALQQARAVAEQAVTDAYKLAQDACQRLQTYFPTWTIRAEARADSPAWGIILFAEEWQADLIVVGSNNRSLLGRLALGSVSQTVVTQAGCSVRVARERSVEPDRPLRLLVGVDGSAQAQAAVDAIAGRVWPRGTDARVIVAINPALSTAVGSPSVQRWTSLADAGGNGWIAKFVESAAGTLAASGLTVSTLIEEGDPKRLLLGEAERWGADCIFVGARGLNRLERLLLGGVSTAVATRAICSVEVVRPTAV